MCRACHLCHLAVLLLTQSLLIRTQARRINVCNYRGQSCRILQLRGPAISEISCIEAEDSRKCVALLASGKAHLQTIEAAEYQTIGTYSLVPAFYEADEAGNSSHSYAVAVTLTRHCSGNTDLSSFKGGRACSSGYGDLHGWTLPLGVMARQGLVTIGEAPADVQVDARTMSAYFSVMCAAGRTEDGPLSGGILWKKGLCGLCQTCEAADPYHGGQGALRCLADGAGDIAFLDHQSLVTFIEGEGKTSGAMEDMRLVCPHGGGCAPLTHFRTCNVAKVPPRIVLSSPGAINSTAGRLMITRLVEISRGPLHRKMALQHLGLLGSTTNELRVVNTSLGELLGQHFTDLSKGIAQVNMLEVSFCTVGENEQAFCEKLMRLLNPESIGAELRCMQADSTTECFIAIEQERATMKSFEFGDMYEAHRTHNLKLIAAEVTEDQSPDLFAMAVVRREFCEQKGGQVTFEDLRGKGMCSTGYFRPNGWHMPVAHLLTSGVMPLVSQDKTIRADAESVMAFFGTACAAGVRDNGPIMTEDGVGTTWKNNTGLCSACKEDECSVADPYFGVRGVYKCLADGAGSVAFAGSESLRTFLTPNNTGRDPEEFRLLCPGGGCAPVTQFAQCNLGRARLQGVMVKSSYPATQQLQSVLMRLTQDPTFRSLVFNTSSNPQEYLFRGMSRGIKPFDGDTLQYLGHLVGGLQELNRIRSHDVITAMSRPLPVGDFVTLQTWALALCILSCLTVGALSTLLVWRVLVYIRPNERAAISEGTSC